MATIDSKDIIDKITKQDGYFEDDPRVWKIVQYTNAYGNITYGVTWSNELPSRRERYLIQSKYVRNPKIIWEAK